MIMKGLHITYDLGRADIVRLGYFIQAWGFQSANPRGRYNGSHLIITDATHPVQDFIELLKNSGCKNLEIHTKNYAHFLTLSESFKLREMGVEIKYDRQLSDKH